MHRAPGRMVSAAVSMTRSPSTILSIRGIRRRRVLSQRARGWRSWSTATRSTTRQSASGMSASSGTASGPTTADNAGKTRPKQRTRRPLRGLICASACATKCRLATARVVLCRRLRSRFGGLCGPAFGSVCSSHVDDLACVVEPVPGTLDGDDSHHRAVKSEVSPTRRRRHRCCARLRRGLDGRGSGSATMNRYLTTDEAAAILSLSPKALRARLRRLQAKRGAKGILSLAPGDDRREARGFMADPHHRRQGSMTGLSLKRSRVSAAHGGNHGCPRDWNTNRRSTRQARLAH